MDIIKTIEEMGFKVRQFSEYHVRVNGVFDFWFPRGYWHDRYTGERGKTPVLHMAKFIKKRFTTSAPEITREEFIRRMTKEIGWSEAEAIQGWEDWRKETLQ